MTDEEKAEAEAKAKADAEAARIEVEAKAKAANMVNVTVTAVGFYDGRMWEPGEQINDIPLRLFSDQWMKARGLIDFKKAEAQMKRLNEERAARKAAADAARR